MIIKKVLLATDFSAPSQQLTDCLVEFKPFGLEEVVLIHVLDVRSPGGSSVSLQKEDLAMLDQSKAKLETKGFGVKAMAPIGFPAQEIVKVAEQEKVSLIAIASHGGGFIKQLFLGSTTTDVIRTSPLPVLIEKYKDVDKATCSLISQNMFKKILVPLDFSIYTDKLLDQVKDAAPLLQEVVLITVIEKARNEMELLGLQIEKERRLEVIKKDLEKLGLKVKYRLGQGSASRNIIEFAEQDKVGLIFMGTRGEGLLENLILGSTAHAVARRAKRPLLLLPPR